jgi:hypothetical protein
MVGSYGSWIYYYLCNQCLSPLTLWVRTPFRRAELNTTLCDKVCHRLATGRWFSPGTVVSSTNKIDSQNKTEILLKVVLSNHKTTKPTIKLYTKYNHYNKFMVKCNNLIWFEYCNLIGWSVQRKFWLCLITWVGIVTSPTYSFANDKFK